MANLYLCSTPVFQYYEDRMVEILHKSDKTDRISELQELKEKALKEVCAQPEHEASFKSDQAHFKSIIDSHISDLERAKAKIDGTYQEPKKIKDLKAFDFSDI